MSRLTLRLVTCPPTVATLANWATTPAKYCATAIDRNHTPIIRPTMRAIDSLVIIDRPTGEMQSSATEWITYRPASHHKPTWKLFAAPAKVVPQTRNRKPAPTPTSATANFTGIEGSRPRRERPVQSMLISGARITIAIGLKFCVCGAEIVNSPNTLLSVLRSANRVSDDPACSNKVQKKTLNTISTIAAHHLELGAGALGVGPDEDCRDADQERSEQQLAHERKRSDVADEARAGRGLRAVHQIDE